MKKALSVLVTLILILSTFTLLLSNVTVKGVIKANNVLVDTTHGGQWSYSVIPEAAESLAGVFLDVVYAPHASNTLESVDGSVNPQGAEGDHWIHEFQLSQKINTLAVVFERKPESPNFLNFWFSVSAPDGRVVDQWNYEDIEGVVIDEPALGIYKIAAVNNGPNHIEFTVKIGEGSNPLSLENLENYDALILFDTGYCEKSVFSKRETDNINSFVKSGKGLLLFWSRSMTKDSLNSISSVYGIAFLETGFSYKEVDPNHYNWPVIRNFAQHSLTEGVTKLTCVGTLLQIDSSKAMPIVWDDDGWPLVAISKTWKLIAVGIGRGTFEFTDIPDHLQFAKNILIWITTPSIIEVKVSWQMVDEPDNLVTPGDRVKFQITLENIGEVDVNDLVLSLSSTSPDVWIAKFEEGKMGGAHPESYNLDININFGSLPVHTSATIYIEVWAKVYSSQDRPWSPFPGLKEELYRRDYSWIDDLPVLGPHDIKITVICNGVTSYAGKMTIDINSPNFSSFYTVQQLSDLKPFLQGSETSPDYPKVDTFHPNNQLIKNVAAKAVAFSLLQVSATAYRLNGAADTPYQAIRCIYDWLGEYYLIGSNVQRWSDTEIVTNMMNKQFGDCSQISDLTISLCRSVKIPTRKLFGAEMRKVGPIWVFTFISSEAHEWAEAYVNNRWVQVDRALRLFDNPLGVYYEHSIRFVHLRIPGLLQGGPWYCKFSDCSAFNTGRITDFLISHKDHFGDAEDNPNNYIP